MNNMQRCPMCTRLEREAYQKGYNEAMRYTEQEIMKAQQGRPIILQGASFIKSKDDELAGLYRQDEIDILLRYGVDKKDIPSYEKKRINMIDIKSLVCGYFLGMFVTLVTYTVFFAK